MQLEFQPEGHVYLLNGRQVPSVTQVLDPYTMLDFVSPAVLEAARIFGQHVHEACHLFNLDELDAGELDPALQPYVAAWNRFLGETGATVIASERRVASETTACAGTLDTLVWWGNSERVIDLKSGIVPRTVGPQTAAYEAFYREEMGGKKRRRHCIQLRGDGTYRNVPLKDPADHSIFLSALNMHHWHGRAPRLAA